MSRKTRKLMWSVPLIAAVAVIGALAAFMALHPGNASADMLPDEPTNLTVKKADEDAGRTTLLLSWTAPAGAVEGYRIDVSENGFVWENLVGADSPHTSTTYTHDKLTSADTRFYRVFAVNSHGVSGVSNVASATTDDKVAPDPVGDLRATANGQKQIDLSWDPPADNGGEKIEGYLILYHNGTDWVVLPGVAQLADNTETGVLSEGTSHQDKSDLTPGETRNYRVIAFNATPIALPADYATAGFGEDNVTASDHRQVQATTAAATAPGRVTGVTAVATDAAEITLYWYGPKSNGGFPLSHYLVQAHRAGESFPAEPDNDGLADITDTQPSLGTGEATNAEWRIPVITAVTTDGTATSQAVIATVAVDHDGDGNPADGTPARQVKWYFRVYAISADGTTFRRSASPSATVGQTPAARPQVDVGGTDVDPLAAPLLVAAERGATPDVTKAGRIELEINIPTGGAEQNAYRIDYSDDGGLIWQLLVPDTRFTGFTLDRRYSDTLDLGYDDTRRYRAFALGANSAIGPASLGQIGHTKASSAPDAPTNVMAAAAADRKSIEVSWTAPEDNGGQPISNYYVQYATDDGDDVAETTDFDTGQSEIMATGSTATSYTVKLDTALPADTGYYVRIAAVNKNPLAANADRPATTATDISWSKLAGFNTSEAAAPGMVEGLTSELATDASGDVRGVLLLWNKPESGGAPTTYQIQRKVNDGDFTDWRNDAMRWPATSTAYTDPQEPAADEMRAYRVRSVNADGMSGWSMVYYPREPDMHTHIAAMGTIPAQTVTVGMTETVNAASYFSDNAGATYEAESDDTAVATVAVNGSMVTITGVAEGTAMITVTATSGALSAMQTFTVTVEAGMLMAPSNVRATQDGNTVTIEWDGGENADTFTVAMLTRMDDGSWDIPNAVYDQNLSGSPHTVNMATRPAGTYLVGVAAGTDDGEWTNWVTISDFDYQPNGGPPPIP